MTDPTPDDIDDVVTCIESELPWAVSDWSHETGRYDTPTLTVELEWAPLSQEDITAVVQQIQQAIEHHMSDDGAPIADVVTAVADANSDMTERVVEDVLERMKQQGEIYTPTEGHIRGT